MQEQDRAKLDGIVQQMIANQESEANIQAVVNDFKAKYSKPEQGYFKETFSDIGQFFTGTAEDASRRLENIRTNTDKLAGTGNEVLGAVSAAGQGLGFLGDVAGRGITTVGKLALSQGQEDAVARQAQEMLTPIIQSAPVQSAITSYQQNLTPTEQVGIEAFGNIADFGLNFLGVGAGTKAVKKGVSAVADSSFKNTIESAGSAIKNAAADTSFGSKIQSTFSPTVESAINKTYDNIIDLVEDKKGLQNALREFTDSGTDPIKVWAEYAPDKVVVNEANKIDLKGVVATLEDIGRNYEDVLQNVIKETDNALGGINTNDAVGAILKTISPDLTGKLTFPEAISNIKTKFENLYGASGSKIADNLKQEIDILLKNNPETVSREQINNLKRNLYLTVDYGSAKVSQILPKDLARGIKNAIELSVPSDSLIKNLNKEYGRLLEAKDFATKVDGYAVKGGRLTPLIVGALGGNIGAGLAGTVGFAAGGPVAAVGSFIASKKIADILARNAINNPLDRKVLANFRANRPDIFQQADEYISSLKNQKGAKDVVVQSSKLTKQEVKDVQKILQGKDIDLDLIPTLAPREVAGLITDGSILNDFAKSIPSPAEYTATVGKVIESDSVDAMVVAKNQVARSLIETSSLRKEIFSMLKDMPDETVQVLRNDIRELDKSLEAGKSAYRKVGDEIFSRDKRYNVEAKQEIVDLNKQIFGDEAVEFVDAIENNKRAIGAYADDMIKILDGQAKPKDTFLHEAVHKYIDVFLTKADKDSLFEYAKSKIGNLNNNDLEEYIAEGFIKYANNPTKESIFKKLFERVKAFFGAEDKINTLYKDILSPSNKQKLRAEVSQEKFREISAKDSIYKLKQAGEDEILSTLDTFWDSKTGSFTSKEGFQTFKDVLKKYDLDIIPNATQKEVRQAGLDAIEARKKLQQELTKPDTNVKFRETSQVLDTLNPTGSIFAKYTPEERAKLPLGKNITTYDKTANLRPDSFVTVYRGTGKSESIVPGDFVTTNKQLAKDYGGNGKVLEARVKASDILDDITEPLGEEYIYRPKQSGIKSNTDQGLISDKDISDSIRNAKSNGKHFREWVQDLEQKYVPYNTFIDLYGMKPIIIGEGSDRITFNAPNNKIIKIAKNSRGLEQMDVDYKSLSEDGLIPKVTDVGSHYVIMDKAKLNSKIVKSMFSEIEDIENSSVFGNELENKIYNVLEKYGYPTDNLKDVNIGEITNINNWGEYLGKPIIVDEGIFAHAKIFKQHSNNLSDIRSEIKRIEGFQSTFNKIKKSYSGKQKYQMPTKSQLKAEWDKI